MGLAYDNSAFYYFVIAVLPFYLVPATYSAVKHVWGRIGGRTSRTAKLRKQLEASASEVERRAIQRILDEEAAKHLLTAGFFVRAVVLAVVWYFFVKCIVLVSDDAEIATYDPFAILGVDSAAEPMAIKRAYRKLSLKWHPDKNQGEGKAAAEEMFLKISKAYEALTDETARKNWEMYGNPDGRQALQVSIGLPTFLLEADNHALVMAVYLIGMCAGIPTVVWLYYSRSKQLGENDILNDTYSMFGYLLSVHTHLKLVPEALACAAEFRKLPLRASDNQSLVRLEKALKADDNMPKKASPKGSLP